MFHTPAKVRLPHNLTVIKEAENLQPLKTSVLIYLSVVKQFCRQMKEWKTLSSKFPAAQILVEFPHNITYSKGQKTAYVALWLHSPEQTPPPPWTFHSVVTNLGRCVNALCHITMA